MDLFDLRKWPGFLAAGGDPSSPAWINHVVIDSRRIHSPLTLFVPLPGSQYDGHQFLSHAAKAGARYALIKLDWTPSSLDCLDIRSLPFLLRVENPLHALQEIASAYRDTLQTQIVGIAGTHGKTMVKDFLHALMTKKEFTGASPESFNSQIGVALSLFTVTNQHKIALIEMGFSEKGEMERLVKMARPNYAIVTHIGKKGRCGVASPEELGGEIAYLLQGVQKEAWVLVPHTPFLPNQKIAASIHYWNEHTPTLPNAVALEHTNSLSLPYRIDFPGYPSYHDHATFGFSYFLNLLNISIKAAWLLGASAKAVQDTLKEYVIEPMCTEIWESPTGVTLINDSYCSDPLSVYRALKWFDKVSPHTRKIFVFGGMRLPLNPLGICEDRHIAEGIEKSSIHQLILVGNRPFDSLIEAVHLCSPHTQIQCAANHGEALTLLQQTAQARDLILVKGAHKVPFQQCFEALTDNISYTQCFINLAAIESNLYLLRKKLTLHTRIMIMVKALAYGTNHIRMSRFLDTCGVNILGVSYTDEGISLKQAGVSQAVFVVNATPHEAEKVVKWELEVGVSDENLIQALSEAAIKQQRSVKVHLHVDTGMNRFGCRPEQALCLAQKIKSVPGLLLEGIMTHFVAAEDPDSDSFTLQQALSFDGIIQLLAQHGIHIPWKHAANSSAAIRFHFPQYNMARIGLAIYGLYTSESVRSELDLRLAVSLVTRIVGINLCKEGETVSYGRSYTVHSPAEKIAILPIGYFDGIHRSYSGKHTVMIRGKNAPMVGKICMDFMMVNVSGIPDVAVGDSVLIFGENEYGDYLAPEQLAFSGNSIAHELLTCLGPRIPRIFLYEESCSPLDLELVFTP